MSGGYGPLYPETFEGSLRGRSAPLLVWAWIIAYKDWNGVIDQHPRCCADATGLDLAIVVQVLEEFCRPDPESRSQVAEGRKLIPLEGRGFGWRVVNHVVYRERARKREYDQRRTESGADAERKRASRDVPPRPAKSRALPLSETESETESKTESDPDSEGDARGNTPRSARRAPAGWKRLPRDWQPDEELRRWAAAKAPDVDFDAELEAIRDYEFKKPHTDPAATVRTWLRTEQKAAKGRKRMNGAPQAAESKFARAKRVLHEAGE